MKTIWSFDLGKASIGEAGTPPASTRAKFSNDVMNRINTQDALNSRFWDHPGAGDSH